MVPYVSKPVYSNSIDDSKYFSNKFRYNSKDNTYICPEGEILVCTTKKNDANQRKYINYDACSKCKNKCKYTTSKKGRTITPKTNQQIGELVDIRTKKNKLKYNQRQAIVEHPFGTIKRTMNFYHLLTRGFRQVGGEISIAFFTYNIILPFSNKSP
ncbi:transposase [Clostridium sporogenes]|uniref:transposase n=1 Tax=Clostridium sporogenes TaxID=1509 RepID=UPI0009B6EBD4|nr:hypothetical protein [Clostridium sporogenes]